MSDEPRRSVRATKGQHKILDQLDQPVEKPKKRSGKKASVKKTESQEPPSDTEEEEIIRCICGVTEQDDESDEDWIACETCSAWQHNICMGVTTDSDELENLNYWCEQCKPENHKELLEGVARGEKPWEVRRQIHEEAELAAQKPKKGKGARGKRLSDPKPDGQQNGKAKSPPTPVEVKKEKKEPTGRGGSVKRKAKDDTDEESSKSKIRKMSTSNDKSGQNITPSNMPATIDQLDKNRQGAARLIHKSLSTAMKKAQSDGVFKGSDHELEAKAMRLALEIERATFDTTQGAIYAGQARKLAANLKSNQELCTRLLSKTLLPSAFAIMTEDEMASKELKEKTAEMKARSDKQSIIITDDGPRMRRTHKGDELIEQVNDAPPPKENLAASVRRNTMDPNETMGGRSRENSIGDGGDELPQDIDDYQSKDDIRANAGSPITPLTVDTSAQRPSISKQSSQAGDFDLNKVFSSIQSPLVGQHSRKASTTQLPRRDGPGEDAEIDKMLEDGNESPPYSPAEFDDDPSIVWRGQMTMNSIASFSAVARHVGGADLSAVGNGPVPWNDLIPTKLQVAGRIDQAKANEYLCSLRYSPLTDIVIVALAPTGEAAGDEFTKLFEYFSSKDRFGVVGNKGIANVRDTYLVPVPAGTGPIPEFMLNLENNKLPHDRPQPMMLVTLVIRSQIPPSQPRQLQTHDGHASPGGLARPPHRQMSLGGQSGPAMSPIAPQGSFASPLNNQAQTPTQPSRTPDHQAQNPRQHQMDQQRQGELVAGQILGELVSAPTVSFLMPQAWQMQPSEWNVIKEIFTEKPNAQNDLAFLSKLLEERNAPEPTVK